MGNRLEERARVLLSQYAIEQHGSDAEYLRGRMIGWLEANDPDGEYSDAAADENGWDRLSLATCAAMLREALATGAVAGHHAEYAMCPHCGYSSGEPWRMAAHASSVHGPRPHAEGGAS